MGVDGRVTRPFVRAAGGPKRRTHGAGRGRGESLSGGHWELVLYIYIL